MTKSYMTFQYSLEETIEELQAQVTSLTKKRDELKDDVTKRMEVADIICKENRDLKSLLSKAEKENKELLSALKQISEIQRRNLPVPRIDGEAQDYMIDLECMLQKVQIIATDLIGEEALASLNKEEEEK